jgi:hypothetical protein
MRQPRFKEIKPNYRKKVLEITLEEKRRFTHYRLPFAVFRKYGISSANRVSSIEFDPELGNHGAAIALEDGRKFDFPADLVLYYCDPDYDWSPIRQLKRALRDKIAASSLSVRVLADALNTSPSQVVRLLEDDRAGKQWAQIFRMAELAGYRIEIQLKKKTA